MKIEDMKIEDAADANYVVRKFFNDQLKNIKMSQLEQLILTVYNMGKNESSSAVSDSSGLESPPEPVNANPFKINDRVKIIEDIEIGHSGTIIKSDTVGTVNSVKGDIVSFLFEVGDDGEMLETNVLFNKLEKI